MYFTNNNPLFTTESFRYDGDVGLLTETYVSGFAELKSGYKTRLGVLLGHTEYYREGQVPASIPNLGPRKINMFLYTEDIFVERKEIITT